jgi:IMP cyclohydrolase
MRNGYKQGDETLNINQVLEKAGCKMSLFLRLNPLTNYKWEIDSILKFIKDHPNDYAIAFEKDGKFIVNILNQGACKSLFGHTLVASNGSYGNVDANNKVYAFIDSNLKYNDDRALIVMSYRKDQYGTLSLARMVDPFNTDITKDGYLSKIGISTDSFLNREAIDPQVLLHKYIDENDEIGAIKLIEKEGNNFNVNYEFNQRVPIISAVNMKMFDLFEKIVNHPKFDSSIEDGFGETLLESLLYLYGSDEISASKEEEASLKRMIVAILKSDTYDYNAKDLNSDTAINIACEYTKMLWIVKALASKKNVDVNVVNDFETAALGGCIRNKNFEALRVIGQRPDLKVTEADKKLAKSYGIDLNEYIKPTEAIFGSYKFEDDDTPSKTAKTKDELEYAMA